MRPKRVLWPLFGVALALAPLQSASAHAAYKSSDPPDGGRVGSPPSRVTAEYTEPLAGGSYLRVTDPCGDRVDAGDVSITGYTMSVSMTGTVAGRYVVAWQAHSQLDPHVTQGEFDFSASAGERCPGEGEREVATASEGGDGGGSTGGNAGGDTAAGSSAAAGSTAGGSSASGGSGQRTNDGSGSRNAGVSSSRRERSGFQPKRATVPNVAAAPEEEAEQPRVWDGIRLEPFLTGLLLAAIIGAAGGKIYAGIMGPRA